MVHQNPIFHKRFENPRFRRNFAKVDFKTVIRFENENIVCSCCKAAFGLGGRYRLSSAGKYYHPKCWLKTFGEEQE